MSENYFKKFVEENKVPSCKIKFFMEDEYRYSFTINDVPYREFDFEVSDEIANQADTQSEKICVKTSISTV